MKDSSELPSRHRQRPRTHPRTNNRSDIFCKQRSPRSPTSHLSMFGFDIVVISRLSCSSIARIHLLACCCGSINNGHLLHFETSTALSVETCAHTTLNFSVTFGGKDGNSIPHL